MASNSLRSSKRPEGISTRTRRKGIVTTPPSKDSLHNTQHLANIGRKKRARDDIDDQEAAISNKKAKIAIEIPPKPKVLHRRPTVIKSNAPSVFLQRSPTTPPIQPAKIVEVSPPPEPSRKPTKSTNHREKVVNGIKHELDRLGPTAKEVDLKDEKRKLRSEGTRFKSELSAYFPEYDVKIGNDPEEPGMFFS